MCEQKGKSNLSTQTHICILDGNVTRTDKIFVSTKIKPSNSGVLQIKKIYSGGLDLLGIGSSLTYNIPVPCEYSGSDKSNLKDLEMPSSICL